MPTITPLEGNDSLWQSYRVDISDLTKEQLQDKTSVAKVEKVLHGGPQGGKWRYSMAEDGSWIAIYGKDGSAWYVRTMPQIGDDMILALCALGEIGSQS